MHRDAPAGFFGLARQGLHHLQLAHRGLAAVGDKGLAVLGQRRRQHHKGGLNTGFTQRHGLGHVGHAEGIVAEILQVPGDDLRVMPVGTRLDAGPETAPAHVGLKQAHVAGQMIEMDVGPGEVCRPGDHSDAPQARLAGTRPCSVRLSTYADVIAVMSAP